MYEQQSRTGQGLTSSYGAFTGHYPNNYSTTTTPASTSSAPYFSVFPHPAPTQPAPNPSDIASAPPEHAVNSYIAQKAIRKLVISELRFIGFETTESPAVRQLELEVEAFIQQLFQCAHEYTNLANRAAAITSDILSACEEFNLPMTELTETAKRGNFKKRKADSIKSNTTLVVPPPRSPSPELLPSDDEGTLPIIPVTLRNLPPHYPSLPPKHTYLKTPASPPKKAALPSLEKKLKTAGLVQESLQHLLLATEDSSNNEDGELLGHIVNWETGIHPRKRWKIGR